MNIDDYEIQDAPLPPKRATSRPASKTAYGQSVGRKFATRKLPDGRIGVWRIF